MIEKRYPIKLPPGLFMNGPMIDRVGRWVDGDGIRFDGEEGIVKPVGSAVAVTTQGATINGVPRHIFSWEDPSGLGAITRNILATHTKLYKFDYSTIPATVTDITPTSWVPETASMDVMGSTVLICTAGPGSQSKLWKWASATGGLAAEIVNFTSAHGATARGVAVTPENFVLVLKGNKDVVWPTQNGITDWTPSTTNSAGGITVPTTGENLRLLVLGSETLILTTLDLWAMTYVGGDLIYGVRNLGNDCGLAGPNCAVTVGNTAYWMGLSGFFQYDGYVRELPSDVHDYVFGNITSHFNAYLWWAQHREETNEIWWHYASSTAPGALPDRYVIYNYLNGTWSKGALSKTASVRTNNSAGNKVIFLADSAGALYQHEQHQFQTPNAFIESGFLPILGGFDRLTRVQRLVSPAESSGDSFSFKYRLALGDVESTAFAANGETRFTGRYIRYRQDMDAADGRVGVPELGVIPSGSR